MAIQIGDVVGDYQVTGVLGRGGMGKVFRVRSLLTDREEAMKIVLPAHDDDPEIAGRFLREIKLHASLQHPNIAAVRAAQRIGEQIVLILELVEGVSLEERLRAGSLPAATAVSYLDQVLAALSFAHQRGVIHRDIKPANILIASGGEVKLTDFGIARSNAATRFTGAGLAVGTLAYMAPEQILRGEADARSDLYSLGLTAYEMVAGRRAIPGESEHALMNAQVSVTPEPPAMTPQVLSAAIMRALAKDPALRFQTAADFRAALHEAEPLPPTATMAATPAFAAQALEGLTEALAPFIGPIAKVVVARAARSARSPQELQNLLAAEIGDDTDRRAFLTRSKHFLRL